MQQAEAEAVVDTLYASYDVPAPDEDTRARMAGSLTDLGLEEALDAIDDLVAEWKPGGGRRMPTQAELRDMVRRRRGTAERMAGASSWSRKHVCPACKGAGWLDRTAEQAERDGKRLSNMAVAKCYVCNGTGKGNELEEPPTPPSEARDRLEECRAAAPRGIVKRVDDVLVASEGGAPAPD
jgi:hypothetical protein